MSSNKILSAIIALLCTLIVSVPVYILVLPVVFALSPPQPEDMPVMPIGEVFCAGVVTLILSVFLFLFFYKRIVRMK
jgi:hypothetical protein